VFVFCHKTPESPRCLIEALMSGAAIVGYDSPYPRDLVGDAADRLLVPRDGIPALARRLAELDADRAGLAALIQAAAAVGAGYSDREVFRHRSELIRRHLSTSDNDGN
jgi:glycosyltransferase involved in cell wall biosynthesis